jgi:hypothetical protein
MKLLELEQSWRAFGSHAWDFNYSDVKAWSWRRSHSGDAQPPGGTGFNSCGPHLTEQLWELDESSRRQTAATMTEAANALSRNTCLVQKIYRIFLPLMVVLRTQLNDRNLFKRHYMSRTADENADPLKCMYIHDYDRALPLQHDRLHESRKQSPLFCLQMAIHCNAGRIYR